MKVLMTILLTLGSSSSFTADLAQVDEQVLDLNEIKELRYSSDKKGLFENKAYEMLSNLRGAGLCP